MEFQDGFNVAAGLLGLLFGWLLNSLRGIVQNLLASDKELTEKIQKIEVLVAGQYVKRNDFERTIEALFEKVDRIYEKLDRKADR